MFKRLLWLGVGIGVGVMVVRVVSKALSPSGIANAAGETIGAAAGSVRGLFDDIVDAMDEREYEIRSAFAEGVALDTPDLPWAQGVGEKFGKFKQQLEGE
jgi:hypothetical protein